MILVIGWLQDPHVLSVLRHLEDDGQPFQVLDLYTPSADGIKIRVSADARLSFCSAVGEEINVKAVWWRLKPPYVIANKSLEDYYNQHFSLNEWIHALSSLEGLLPVYWINNRKAHVLASNKINQIRIACEEDVPVPRTLVSNNLGDIRSFLREVGPAGCVYKTMMPYFSPEGRQTYTTLLDAEKLEQISQQVGVCPGIYQGYIACESELRVTVVGSDIFAAKITKQDRRRPDWRRELEGDIYKLYSLTAEDEAQILRLHRRFGLVYGAYDFLVDANGRLVFLEVNPSGQWLWIEERLGLPISRRIADLLASVEAGAA